MTEYHYPRRRTCMTHPHDINLGNLSESELSNVMSDICKDAALDYEDYSFTMSVGVEGALPVVYHDGNALPCVWR